MNIKVLLYTVSLAIVFNSCSTLIHQRTVNMIIKSDVDSVKFCINNDINDWYKGPAIISVLRSKKDLILCAERDSVQKLISIRSKLSNSFWFGNIYALGIIGYCIDLTNPKRFTYPRYLTINFDKANYTRWIAPEKGLLNIKFSVPEGNQFYLNKGKAYGKSFGFLGISTGIEYYFTNKYCINADLGTLTDFMMPFPAPIRYEGNYSRSFAIYGDVQVGSDFKRIHYDVGLHYNRTKYYEYDTLSIYSDTLKYYKVQNNTGLALSAYYKFSNGFSLGINYYPSINLPEKNTYKIHYSHLIFFEFIFKFEAIRPGIKRFPIRNYIL